jgi:hypothetical protein
MLDTTTQAIAVADTPQVVTFNTTVQADKIAVTSSSRFTVNEGGQYLISAIAQVTASSANKTIDIWFRINGSDVVNSNTKMAIKNTGDVLLLPLGGMIVTMTAGQYFEIWTSGDSTDLSIIYYAAGVTPTRPVTSSLDLTIAKIHP